MLRVAQETLYMVLVIVLGTMGMGFVIGKVNGMYFTNMNKTFGNSKIRASSLVGVPMHELGHYLMCKIFGHKVTTVNLINFDSTSNLGSVEHSYNPLSIRQSLGTYFIAQGPLWVASLSIIVAMKLLIPGMLVEYVEMQSMIMGSSYGILEKILKLTIFNLTQIISKVTSGSIRFWAFILITTSISLYADMSYQDLKNAVKGIKPLVLIVFVINLIGGTATGNNVMIIITKYNLAVTSMLILILTMSSIALAFSIAVRITMGNSR